MAVRKGMPKPSPMKTDYLAGTLANLDKQLHNIRHLQHSDPIGHAQTAITFITCARHELNNLIRSYTFTNEHEEIHYFKNIKAPILAQLIYYNSVRHILLKQPPNNTPEEKKQYLRQYLDRIHQFYHQQQELIAYYRGGSTHLDILYFTRKHYTQDLILLDNDTILEDPQTSTTQLKNLARLLACDQLQIYLNQQLSHTQPQQTPKNHKSIHKSGLKWTAPKAALIEVLYALHSQGVFNNGTIELKQIAEHLQNVFNVDLRQYHRAFIEIRNRKTGRTKFLDELKQTLIGKMEEIGDLCNA